MREYNQGTVATAPSCVSHSLAPARLVNCTPSISSRPQCLRRVSVACRAVMQGCGATASPCEYRVLAVAAVTGLLETISDLNILALKAHDCPRRPPGPPPRRDAWAGARAHRSTHALAAQLAASNTAARRRRAAANRLQRPTVVFLTRPQTLSPSPPPHTHCTCASRVRNIPRPLSHGCTRDATLPAH